ncbi:MAG: glycosyltransferase family 4 protein [Armatimonadetes bacterium]|nr:glycosyltransferase family 4 protein [Armatimonadota bacterium]
MKILFCIDSLLPGGAENSLILSLPLMREAGVEPLLVCLKRVEIHIEAMALERGVVPHYLSGSRWCPRKRWYLNLPRWVRELRGLVREHRPCLVHSTLYQSCLTSRLALIGTGIPLLNSIVNMDYSPVRLKDPARRGGPWLSTFKLEFFRLLNRLTAPLASHFHAVTPAIRDDAIQKLGLSPDRISVVYRGREETAGVSSTLEQRLSLKQQLGVDASARLLMNTGRQDYQKGQSVLLQALPQLGPDSGAVLLIAGRDGSMTPHLKSLIADYGLERQVLMLGHRPDVPQLLAGSDLFLLPSLYEGAAGALLEAMAAGMPIVASDLPELRGLVRAGENGLLAPPAAPGAWAEAIRYLLGNPEVAARIGQEARRDFLERFTLEKSVQGMVDLYRTLAR